MRFTEFKKLNEESEITSLKKEIVGQVKQTDDFNILDRVHQVLSHSRNQANISKAFGKNIKTGNISNQESVVKDMVSQISNLPGTTKQKDDFIKALEHGKAVDLNALMRKDSNFSNVFPTKMAEDFFMSIANYGRAVSMKGPGEFALAIMSPKIALADKGDLVIAGKHVEVKAALSSSGGRFGEVGASKDQIVRNLERVGPKWAKTPEQRKAWKKFVELNSITFGPAVKILHTIFDDKRAIKEIVSTTVALTLDKKSADLIGTSAANDPTGLEAEKTYMKANFEWYKKRDGFDAMLAIWFGGKKMYYFSTGEQLMSLRNSGIFGNASVAFIPTKPNELYAKINFTKAGLSAADVGGEGPAKDKPPAKEKPAEPKGKVKASAGGREKPTKSTGVRGKRK